MPVIGENAIVLPQLWSGGNDKAAVVPQVVRSCLRYSASVSICSPGDWNSRYYILLLIYNDDGMTAILIIVVCQLIGHNLGMGDGVSRPVERRSLIVFDRQSAPHNVKEVSLQLTPAHHALKRSLDRSCGTANAPGAEHGFGGLHELV
jgi:hypothetical protein